MLSNLALLGLAVGASAHFVLQIPTSLGFDDELEATGPCGSFDPTDRSKGVSGWSVNGGNVGVLSTHTSVTWELNAALLSAPTTWLPLVQTFAQKGVGNVCFAKVPGFAAWAGQDAVLQVIQHGPDGALYQASPFFSSLGLCAAIKFVAGGPDAVPGDCNTSSGVSIAPIIPAAGPTSSTSSSTSAPAAASSTTTAAAAAAATSAPATSSKASSSVPSDGHSHSHVHTSSSSAAAATAATATTSIGFSAAAAAAPAAPAASGNATTTTTSSKLPVVTAGASASATVAGGGGGRAVAAAAAALGLLSLLLLAGPIGV
ncbi:hypothetical protein B0T24DRAFT_525482 [Lasiosphaeria ovina]|uniref:Copper acquisition factor BIM1-like domain-containing protein n=1 Tax=Lasiosphaeria ovina TaxID=92902 RepID=A0AAE0NAP4_9PEZI|nr:hypothetical protein B0T24DRAFT_525482 [Lasiosphaeria ovina]